MYEVEYTESAATHLAGMRLYDRAPVLEAIATQLTHQPNQPTRNRKKLLNLQPPWDFVEPLWELRVGEYRVFYDVDEQAKRVFVRAVRHKPLHKTTEEIL